MCFSLTRRVAGWDKDQWGSLNLGLAALGIVEVISWRGFYLGLRILHARVLIPLSHKVECGYGLGASGYHLVLKPHKDVVKYTMEQVTTSRVSLGIVR